MFLTGFVILINAIGGVLLFLWGPYFFSSTMALIFAGFSCVQAATAAIAFFGLCNVSFIFYIDIVNCPSVPPFTVEFIEEAL